MRSTLFAGAVLLGGLVTASSAMAATDWSSMSCAEFGKLGPSAQADIAAQVGPASLATSQTSNSGTMTSTATTGSQSASGPAGQPVSADQLAAACQAQPSTTTLHDIVSRPGAVDSSGNNGSQNK